MTLAARGVVPRRNKGQQPFGDHLSVRDDHFRDRYEASSRDYDLGGYVPFQPMWGGKRQPPHTVIQVLDVNVRGKSVHDCNRFQQVRIGHFLFSWPSRNSQYRHGIASSNPVRVKFCGRGCQLVAKIVAGS
jgi:hypothetical protein